MGTITNNLCYSIRSLILHEHLNYIRVKSGVSWSFLPWDLVVLSQAFPATHLPLSFEFYMLSQIILGMAVTKDSAAALPWLCWSKYRSRNQSTWCSIYVDGSCDAVAGDLGMKKLVLRTQCPQCTQLRDKGCYFRLSLNWSHGLNAYLSLVGGTPSPSEFSLCTLAAPDVNQSMEYLLQKCILELN